MIFHHISDDLAPKTKILNMVFLILMHCFCLKLERCKPHKAACHPMNCDVINEGKLLQNILSQNF